MIDKVKDPVAAPEKQVPVNVQELSEKDFILINSAKHGDAFRLEQALRTGANINAQDGAGMTALHHAAAVSARACLRILVKNGRCDYLIRDAYGRYPSDLAIEWGNDPAVERLLTRKECEQADRQGVPAWIPPDA